MKKVAKVALSAGLLVTLLMQTGCFGRFNVTMKAYDFIKVVGNKFNQELVFLAFNINW